jgi:hypothetical protein
MSSNPWTSDDTEPNTTSSSDGVLVVIVSTRTDGDDDDDATDDDVEQGVESFGSSTRLNHGGNDIMSSVVLPVMPEPPPIWEEEEDQKQSATTTASTAAATAAATSSVISATATTTVVPLKTIQKRKKKKKNTPQIPPPFFCPITQQLFLEPVVGPDGISYERSILLGLSKGRQGRSTTTTTESLEEEGGSSPDHPPDADVINNENTTPGLQPHDLYPNRVLQRIMEEYMDLQEETWDAGIRRYMQQGIDYLVSHSTPFLSSRGIPHDRPLPDAYYCPITLDLFHTPVIDPEGNTYEEAAIVPWILTNGRSPLSRTPLSIHQLYPNHAIRQLLEYHASTGDDDNDDDNNDYEVDGDGNEEEEEGSSEYQQQQQEEQERYQLHPALRNWKTEAPPTVPEATHGSSNQQALVMLNSNANNTNTNVSVTENSTSAMYHHQQQQQQQHHEQQEQHHPYPTTWQELEWYRETHRRHRHRTALCTMLGFVGFIAALVVAILYGGYCIFVAVWLACCVRDGCQRYRTLHHEQQIHIRLTEERIQEANRRLEQLQARLYQLRALDGNEATRSTAGRDGGTLSTMTRLDPSFMLSSLSHRQIQDQVEAEEQALVRRRHQERLAELEQQQQQQQQQQQEQQEHHDQQQQETGTTTAATTTATITDLPI